ncbi:hypothetical protein SKAU_G00399420 [Synaphobranchus kaupii]|uniref:Uncharacterized protein n=1 Tax=Synaphobranchus kaupii TaxID=118154 RepID=A0A9Q1IA81_SYNKA|nr:hypothetical protein SKAU_G00399420 [Synaphobranchus kaupii]
MEGTRGPAEIACCQEPALTLQDGQGPAHRAGCRSSGLGPPDIPLSHTLRPGCFALQVIKVGSRGRWRFEPDPTVTALRPAVSAFRQEPPGASTSPCHFSPLPSSPRNTQKKKKKKPPGVRAAQTRRCPETPRVLALRPLAGNGDVHNPASWLDAPHLAPLRCLLSRGALCAIPTEMGDELVGPCCCFHDNREKLDSSSSKEIELTTQPSAAPPPPQPPAHTEQPGEQGHVETLHDNKHKPFFWVRHM